MDEEPYTSAEFHNDVHKQVVNAVSDALSTMKFDWPQVAPFLEAGRAICRDDVRLNGRFAIHGLEYRGTELVEADEAFLSISVRDREDDSEWLSQTYWLSDIALADQDPERVRNAAAAIERTAAKLRQWLADREATGQAEAGEAPEAPPAG